MFNTFKQFFGTTAKAEFVQDISKTGQKIMTTFARIDNDNNLFGPNGQFIGTYSRRRDAIRGAKRRGLTLAS